MARAIDAKLGTMVDAGPKTVSTEFGTKQTRYPPLQASRRSAISAKVSREGGWQGLDIATTPRRELSQMEMRVGEVGRRPRTKKRNNPRKSARPTGSPTLTAALTPISGLWTLLLWPERSESFATWVNGGVRRKEHGCGVLCGSNQREDVDGASKLRGTRSKNAQKKREKKRWNMIKEWDG